ncbi:MAG: acyl-CoA dehydrogenase family protein [Candidatus Lokiarchaeota archaeon]|jgi:butyryl-CoA dehydrogenase|nr:acyl-CoA dehydrogenase family protein [Candidatus Lokiarchaeota archaeon]
MDFSLTEKQQMLKKITRQFAEEYIVPVARESDEKQELNDKVFQKMKEMNFFGGCIPEEYGGAGLEHDTIGFCIVLEEIARGDAAWGITTAVHNGVAAYPIYKYGTEEQKQKFLIDLAKGNKVGAFCLTEANAGSDAGGVQLTAVKDGDDYILNGTKIFATSGGIAGTLLVVAKTGEKDSRKQLTVFIVDAEMPGYSVGVKEDKMGVRASNTSELVFQDVRVPQENILGNPGEGFKMAMKILDFGRIGIAAQCVGLGQAALEASIKYANERVQFNKPIGRFQAIQWKIADMAVAIESARLFTYKAAYLHDKGLEFGMASSMAKLVASEAAMQAAHSAVQIHGGYGLMKAYPVERYFRDAKMGEIYEGTSEIQRLVIATTLLRKGA